MHNNKIIRLICKIILDNVLQRKFLLGKIEIFINQSYDFNIFSLADRADNIR
jgi:hypothetical protein